MVYLVTRRLKQPLRGSSNDAAQAIGGAVIAWVWQRASARKTFLTDGIAHALCRRAISHLESGNGLVTFVDLLPPAHASRARNGIRKETMLQPRRRICQPMITIVVHVTGRSKGT
jgi:hypothetical protein